MIRVLVLKGSNIVRDRAIVVCHVSQHNPRPQASTWLVCIDCYLDAAIIIMTSSPRIIPLEEGWEKEIKEKVSIKQSIFCFVDM
jgi:translation initiation factor 2 gamma subunit (eIF-2gamma)